MDFLIIAILSLLLVVSIFHHEKDNIEGGHEHESK